MLYCSEDHWSQDGYSMFLNIVKRQYTMSRNEIVKSYWDKYL